jgi:hypothetical protein
MRLWNLWPPAVSGEGQSEVCSTGEAHSLYEKVKSMTPTPPTKLGIAIDLDELESLAKDYIRDMGGDGDNDISERLTLSSFIVWLRQRESTNDNNLSQLELRRSGERERYRTRRKGRLRALGRRSSQGRDVS